MNLYAILTGWQNYLDKSEVAECKAIERAKICASCPESKQGKLLAIIKDDLKEVEGFYCNICKCILSAKIRQNTEPCPLGKW